MVLHFGIDGVRAITRYIQYYGDEMCILIFIIICVFVSDYLCAYEGSI